MTFETSVAILACIFAPIALYLIVRVAQAIEEIRKSSAIRWNLQEHTNKQLADSIAEYMPQGVTLQQIKSELSAHLQQHAARDMRQAGTLNTTDYPNLRGDINVPSTLLESPIEKE